MLWFYLPDEVSDYNPMGVEVTFTSGAVFNGDTECITVGIVDDADFEAEQTFEVLLSLITPNVASGTGDVAAVIILDNNGNSLQLDALRKLFDITFLSTDAVVVMETSTQSVGEPSGSLDVCVASGILGSVDRALTVTLASNDGKASKFKILYYIVYTSSTFFIKSTASPEDYTPPSPTTLVFSVGGTDSTLCTTVEIINDNELESDHEFTVEITDISPGSPHAIIGDPSATIVTIEDDEGKVKYQ